MQSENIAFAQLRQQGKEMHSTNIAHLQAEKEMEIPVSKKLRTIL